MASGLGRAFWWIFTYERPRWVGDYVGLVALVGLAVLGALVLAWPWLAEEVPKAVGQTVAVAHETLAYWLEQLQAALPRPEWPEWPEWPW